MQRKAFKHNSLQERRGKVKKLQVIRLGKRASEESFNKISVRLNFKDRRLLLMTVTEITSSDSE